MSTTTAAVFTDRQVQIIGLIAQGLSNEEIGKFLGRSSRTAKAHSDVLRQKLQCEKRRQIPLAYSKLTGENPLLIVTGAVS